MLCYIDCFSLAGCPEETQTINHHDKHTLKKQKNGQRNDDGDVIVSDRATLLTRSIDERRFFWKPGLLDLHSLRRPLNG